MQEKHARIIPWPWRFCWERAHLVFSCSKGGFCDWCLVWYYNSYAVFNFRYKIRSCWMQETQLAISFQGLERSLTRAYPKDLQSSGIDSINASKPCNSGIFCQLHFIFKVIPRTCRHQDTCWNTSSPPSNLWAPRSPSHVFQDNIGGSSEQSLFLEFR